MASKVLWKCGACEDCFYELNELAAHKCIGNAGTITLTEQCIKQLESHTFSHDIDNEQDKEQVEQAISAIAAMEEGDESIEFDTSEDHNVTYASSVVAKKQVRKKKPNIVGVETVLSTDRKVKRHQKGKRSLVWAYFSALDCKKAMCCICGKVIAYCGTPTNLVYHLNRFHPNESEIIKSKHAGGAKYQYLENKIPKDTPYGRMKGRTTVNILSRAKRPFVSSVSIQKKTIPERIVDLVVADLLPINIVEGEGFKTFVKSFDPSAEIPDGKKVLKDLMPKLYYSESKRVKHILCDFNHLHVSLELWNDSKNDVFMTISTHSIANNFDSQCHTIKTTNMGPDPTSKELCTSMLSCLSDWDLSPYVSCVVTDDSDLILDAISNSNSMKNKHVVCLAHTLNRIVKESFQGSHQLNRLIEKCRKLVCFLKEDEQAKQKLIEIQTQDKRMRNAIRDHMDMADTKTSALQPVKDIPGYWITMFHMLQRIFTLRNAINIILDDNSNCSLTFSENDWLAIEETISLLKSFEVVTLELCSERYPCLSKVIPIVSGLLSLVNNCNCLTLDYVEAVRRNLLSKLKRRLGNVEINLNMAMATILDPRFKNIAFQSDSAVDAAVSGITVEGRAIHRMEPLDVPKPSSEKNTSYTDSLWESFERKATPRKEQVPSDDAITTEIKNYFDEALIDRKRIPTAWWKDYGIGRYPILGEIAKKMLGVPATSVPPERIFLQNEKNYLERRKAIKSKYIDQFVFLSANKSD